MAYRPEIDVDRLVALDMHVHIEADDHGHASLPPVLEEAASAYFKSDGPRPTIDGIAAHYRAVGMVAVVFTVDARTQLGHPPLDSAEIAAGAADNADVLIPFGSVDPRLGAEAIDLASSLIADAGVRGFKFHPTVQGFDPSDESFRPLWQLLSDARMPLVFHTGQTGIGAGLPGGAGLRLGLSNPMLLDGIAADFPELQIVMAHPSVPWQAEAISIATHKANAWIDLSGWSPTYFPEELVRQAGGRLKHKVLFGSDFPLLTPERWLRDFAALPIPDDARPGILRDNAVRLLGLDHP